MADNNTGLNGQYDAGSTPFGMSAGIGSTNAPGTPGITAAETAGAVIASPAIIASPYSSSQVPGNFSHVAVTSGDTSGMSDDAPVPSTGDPLTGLSLGQVTTTGAGQGSGEHIPHPNSMARP